MLYVFSLRPLTAKQKKVIIKVKNFNLKEIKCHNGFQLSFHTFTNNSKTVAIVTDKIKIKLKLLR